MKMMIRMGLLAGSLALLLPVRASAQRVGTVRFPVSCAAPAQTAFNRSVALLHSFAFSTAIDGFHDVLRIDPHCAMAYWGLALSAWGNPFAAGIKPASQIRTGQEAVDRGRGAGPPTDRERGYVEAVARLYDTVAAPAQRDRLLAYRDAMANLVAREPADTEAAIFHALAQAVAADPGDKSYASQLAAGATLERLFRALPDHPGLAHYIIHSYDLPALAPRALAAAARYSRIAPAVSHALHMPSHTFTRVGEWDRSIAANVTSADAARREGAVAEELHSDDYRVYAYLQEGRDKAAARLLAEIPALAQRLDPNAIGTGAPPAAGYFAIAAVPARYTLERGDWAAAARLEVRPSPVPFANAITHFARALGSARSGDTAGARAAITTLGQIREALAGKYEDYWSEQVEIQRRAASAWLLLAEGRNDDALTEMRAAAERESATEKNAITPGPIAPARELLGEMLLSLHRPAEALTEFKATLNHEPNRFRTLFGAAQAARESGDRATARKFFSQLLRVCARADQPVRADLAAARSYMAH
jgi:hypothetical protein